MSTGLIALLDDVAGIAKVAAASVDDAIGQAGRAGVKAAGVVVDDAAVTPSYAVGFAPARELPIVGKIALGSLKNKLLFLLPAALGLSAFASAAITPLLMAGGAYLCFEGAEKLAGSLFHGGHGDGDAGETAAADPAALEKEKVSGAIRTDLILSAEIMAITLATVAAETQSIWNQAFVLALVGVGITVAVYGAVALIVKADDVGLFLARKAKDPVTRGLGRGLVRGMPPFLALLGAVGTAAMLWVGGGILVHGLAHYGLTVVEHPIHAASEAVAHAVPPGFADAAGWAVSAAGSGLFGLAVGAVLVGLVHAATALMPKKAAH